MLAPAPRTVRRVKLVLLAIGIAAACAASDAGAQTFVAFATRDSGVVTADEYGTGTRAVLLVPGGRFDRRSWALQARAFADAGLRVLAIDLRGRGDTRIGRAGLDSLHLDVLGAIAYLRATGAKRLTVVGASLGGWAAAEAVVVAAPAVDGLVLIAHAAIDRPERLRTPTLFMVGRGDTRGGDIPRLPSA